MGTLGTLAVSIIGDSRDMEKAFDGANKKAGQLAQNIQKVGKNVTRFGKDMTKYVTLPIVGLFGGMAKAAMDLEATEAKYNAVFAGMTETSDQFIKDFQKLTPATTAEARSMASGIQDLLVPMGFLREEATEMTAEFMHVTGALANFNSGTHSAQDVANAMASALSGQYMPLRSLGIQLDKTTITQKAFEMGLISNRDELTKQIEAQVMLAEVYAQSGDALEAYTEENLDAKTKMALAKAEVIDLAAEFGQNLLPMINQGIDLFRQITAWVGSLTAEQQQAIMRVLALVAALGPLLMIVGKVITVFGTLVKAAGVVKGILAVIATAIGAPVAAVAVLVAAIGGLIYWFLTGTELGRKIWQGFVDWITGLFQKFYNWLIGNSLIPDLIKGIISWFGRLPKAVANIVSNMTAGAIRIIRGFVDTIRRILSGVTNAILSPFRKAREGLSNITSGIRSTLNRINPFAKSSPSLVEQVSRGTQKMLEDFKRLETDLSIAPLAHTLKETEHGSLSVGGRIDINIAGDGAEHLNEGAIAEAVTARVVDMMSSGDRRVPNRTSLVPGM